MGDLKNAGEPDVAKLFWTGRSQAVRLPKAFRFEGQEVRIRRQGQAVILEPAQVPEDGWAWLGKFKEPLDEDFMRAALEDVPQQERPEQDQM